VLEHSARIVLLKQQSDIMRFWITFLVVVPVITIELDRAYMHGSIARKVFYLLNQWL
jgi:hypothetical protein